MSFRRQNINFKTSPSGLLVPTGTDDPALDAVDMTFELVSSAKGDVLAGDGSGAFVKKAVGSDGQVLTADAASAGGVKWSTPAAGGGGGALVAIADSTLGADAASLSISSIPGTYAYLKVVIQARTDRAATSDFIQIKFNNDTGANYYDQTIEGNGGTASAGQDVAQTRGLTMIAMGDTGVTNAFSVHELLIPEYASTSKVKTMTGTIAAFFNTTSNFQTYAFGGLWNQTAAITSVKVEPIFGTNLKAGTRMTIYGMSV